MPIQLNIIFTQLSFRFIWLLNFFYINFNASKLKSMINFIKHFITRLLALLLFIALLPLFIIISIIIFIETKKSPIFIQERGLTLDKCRFKIYKFRTIKETNVPLTYSPNKILTHPESAGALTFIGKFLRTSGLDELPQLLNIIKGDMNFIGPRPLMISDLEQIKNYYPQLYALREKICEASCGNTKPGLTGLWQISKDPDYSVEFLIEKDIEYEKNKSPLLNLYILFVTLKLAVLLKHKDSLLENNTSLKVFYLINFTLSFIWVLIVLLIVNKLN